MPQLSPQDLELMSALARQVPGVIYQYRPFADGRSCFPFASAAIREIYEVTPEEVREDATVVFGRLHLDDLERVSASITRSASTLTTWSCEYRVRLPERGLRWLRGLANPERMPDGSTLWHGFITDITAQRRDEEELRLRDEAMATAMHGIVIADLEGRVRYANPTFARLWGFPSVEAVVGRTSAGFSDPERSAMIKAALLREGIWQGEIRATRTDGTGFEAFVSANVVRDGHGRPAWMLASISDITDLKRLQGQFAQAQKMETVGRLAGGVAHDFNNLLTVMKGYLAIAREKLDPGSPLDADLAEVEHAADSAAALTGQLLTFSRRQAITPQVLDLTSAVRGVEGMLRRLLGEAVSLRVQCAATTARVRFDPSQLEQVLVNLAVNARDAMPGGGCVTIETQEVELDAAYALGHPEVSPGDYVLIAVHDTGSGISDEMRGHLFEPFYTTKEQGRGTGLGLAMVYGAVTQNDGRIEVYSEAGRGTTFKIYLPAVHDAPAPRVSPPASAMPRGDETIAVVEDEPAIRALAARILRTQGYTVREYEQGRAALAALRDPSVRLDLLVTDVIMPELDGRRLADALRAVRPALRVLYASGYTEDVIAHHGVLDGDVDFLAKPYSVATLARRVREALDRPTGS